MFVHHRKNQEIDKDWIHSVAMACLPNSFVDVSGALIVPLPDGHEHLDFIGHPELQNKLVRPPVIKQRVSGSGTLLMGNMVRTLHSLLRVTSNSPNSFLEWVEGLDGVFRPGEDYQGVQPLSLSKASRGQRFEYQSFQDQSIMSSEPLILFCRDKDSQPYSPRAFYLRGHLTYKPQPEPCDRTKVRVIEDLLDLIDDR